MANQSQKAFEKALKELKTPRGQQAQFLRIHAQAKGQAMTMKRLAQEVGYRS
ncbi:MAG TPA: hypothetical protein VJ785_16585 [Anaerolineales bacterium]|nr:hypothetical protein [Anaerolineales bacterium]